MWWECVPFNLRFFLFWWRKTRSIFFIRITRVPWYRRDLGRYRLWGFLIISVLTWRFLYRFNRLCPCLRFCYSMWYFNINWFCCCFCGCFFCHMITGLCFRFIIRMICCFTVLNMIFDTEILVIEYLIVRSFEYLASKFLLRSFFLAIFQRKTWLWMWIFIFSMSIGRSLRSIRASLSFRVMNRWFQRRVIK